MPQTNRKLEVCLEESARQELEALCRKGTAPVAKVRKARVLLLADEDRRIGRKPDWRIAEIVGVSERQVVRIRQKFVREGLKPTLERKPRSAPGTAPKFDGPAEARLVTLCCSTPPEGHQRWTLQLLVDELCRLQVVTSVCRETVRQCLKKIGSSPGRPNVFAYRKRIGRGSWPRWSECSMFITRSSTTNTR